MNKRLGAVAIVMAVVATAAGLLASPSSSASTACPMPHGYQPQSCEVSLTATGISAPWFSIPAGWYLWFFNADSVTHEVDFSQGPCTLTLTPGEEAVYPGGSLNGRNGSPHCGFVPQYDNFSFYVGRYSFTVLPNKPTAQVATTPLPRSVTLTARTHTIRGGTSLTLHGQVIRSPRGPAPPPPVVILARHNTKQAFEPVATVRTRGFHRATWGWKLNVQPDGTTTYIAKVTAQRLCYLPETRCAHPHGQIWANATSRPFTVRIRH